RERAAHTSAIRGDLDFHEMGGARREKRDFKTNPECDRRNHIQSTAKFAAGRLGGDLHRLVGNNQGLAADFEDVLDWEGGRILRAANKRGIIDAEYARRALFAQP